MAPRYMVLQQAIPSCLRIPFLHSPQRFGRGRFISNAATRPPLPIVKQTPALSRLPSKTLVRSLVVTSLMTSQWLLRPSLALLALITNSKCALLKPESNPILERFLRWTVYNHFCAGATREEVLQSVTEIKRMGYQGVILGYSKEIVLDPNEREDHTSSAKYSPKCYEMVDKWKEGTLQTLSMIGPGDFLAVKLTGAGPIAVDAMQDRKPLPKAIEKALDEICSATANQGSRLWLDAEQQVLQPGLDDWAIELMRRYNRNGHALVYNTIQGYLKGSKANVDRAITLAAQEGWTLGIKLVRGAYIEHDVRSLIHDTKKDTDRSYDLIADTFVSRKLPAGAENLTFPSAALFLATHNAASVENALSNHRQRLAAGLPTVLLECGQVQGMADELSCELLENYDKCQQDSSLDKTAIPRVFKYLTWGSVGECMGYLHRRAIENRGAIERCHHMTAALKQELRRRVFG